MVVTSSTPRDITTATRDPAPTPARRSAAATRLARAFRVAYEIATAPSTIAVATGVDAACASKSDASDASPASAAAVRPHTSRMRARSSSPMSGRRSMAHSGSATTASSSSRHCSAIASIVPASNRSALDAPLRAQPPRCLGHDQHQVEFRGARAEPLPFDLETGERKCRPGIGLQCEHHLEERMPPRLALDIQFLDQSFERHFLVRSTPRARLRAPVPAAR